MVKMNRACDVSMILSQRAKLANTPSISVRQDLSPQERQSKALLLKERWRLLQGGVDRKSIKISGSAIYVNNVKSGQVNNRQYVPCSSVASPNHGHDSIINTSNFSSPPSSGTDVVSAGAATMQ